MSREKLSLGFLTRSVSNGTQKQKMVRGLKLVNEVEELYYPCGENKGADHDHGGKTWSYEEYTRGSFIIAIYTTPTSSFFI